MKGCAEWFKIELTNQASHIIVWDFGKPVWSVYLECLNQMGQ